MEKKIENVFINKMYIFNIFFEIIYSKFFIILIFSIYKRQN